MNEQQETATAAATRGPAARDTPTRPPAFAAHLEKASAELDRLLSEARRRLVAPLEVEPSEPTIDLASGRDKAPPRRPDVDPDDLVARAGAEAARLVAEASTRAEALLHETEHALRVRAEGILAVLEPLRLALDRLDTLRALVEIAAARLSEIVEET